MSEDFQVHNLGLSPGSSPPGYPNLGPWITPVETGPWDGIFGPFGPPYTFEWIPGGTIPLGLHCLYRAGFHFQYLSYNYIPLAKVSKDMQFHPPHSILQQVLKKYQDCHFYADQGRIENSTLRLRGDQTKTFQSVGYSPN